MQALPVHDEVGPAATERNTKSASSDNDSNGDHVLKSVHFNEESIRKTQWQMHGPEHGDVVPIDDSTLSALSPTSSAHVKTYTAGEDAGRLQQAARELGLAKARQPKPQVRDARKRSWRATKKAQHAWHVLLDQSTEDARMRAILTTRHAEDEAGIDTLSASQIAWMRSSMPEYLLTAVIEDVEADEDDDEVDRHDDVRVGGNLTSAVLGIIKGMVGPAILYLPHGFATAGYLVALPIMIVCTIMFLYSAQCLLDSWKYERQRELDKINSRDDDNDEESSSLLSKKRRRRKRTIVLSYPELAYRALGRRGEALVKTGIALMQSGVCLTYLIFVPQNLHTSCWQLTAGRLDWSPRLWLLVMIGTQVPLSWIRDIRKLTPTNLVANSLILYGLIICLGYALTEATYERNPEFGPIDEIWHHVSQLKAVCTSWFLFVGTSVLLFEGSITLLLPLQEAVQTEEKRAQFPAVYRRTILGIICFYVVFGLTNWMAYGQEVRTVLTTSLPNGGLATTVQLAYSVAVIFTFPLQNFPALEIACRSLSRIFAKRTPALAPILTQRNVLSSLLVLLLAVVAVCTMDALDKVVSLMGSLLGCPLAFCFPPLIHTYLLQKTGGSLSKARRMLNFVVFGLGLLAMLAASAVTLATWN